MNGIVLDEFNTLPLEIQNMLVSKEDRFDDWYKKLKSMDIYNNDLADLIEEITEYLEEENPRIVTFHATRLFEYEVEDIIRNGFKIPTEDFIKQRLKKMCEYMEYDENVYNKLLEKTSLKTQNKGRKFWFISTSSTLCDNGFIDLYKYWGGESIYFHSKKINTLLFELISSHTVPCLYVGSLEYNDIDYKNLIAQKIIKFHILQRLNKDISSCEGFESKSSTVPKISRIIKYNDTSFYDYVGEYMFDKIR